MNFFKFTGMMLFTAALMALGGFMFHKLPHEGVIALGCILGFTCSMGLISRAVDAEQTVKQRAG